MNSRVRAARMESLDDEVLLETGVGIGVWMRSPAAPRSAMAGGLWTPFLAASD